MPDMPFMGSASGVKGPSGLSAVATPMLKPRLPSPLGVLGK